MGLNLSLGSRSSYQELLNHPLYSSTLQIIDGVARLILKIEENFIHNTELGESNNNNSDYDKGTFQRQWK